MSRRVPRSFGRLIVALGLGAVLLCPGCVRAGWDPGPIPDGIELVYQLQFGPGEAKPGLARDVVRVLRARVPARVRPHCHMESRGEDRVVVQVRRGAGVDVEHLRGLIERRSMLEFRLCCTDPAMLAGAKAGKETPGYDRHWVGLRRGEQPDPAKPEGKWHLVSHKVALAGDCLADVQPTMQGVEPAIAFKMDNAGAREFARITDRNVGAPLAILIDGKLISAPTIKDRIAGSGVISGDFTQQEVNDLCVMLRVPALPPGLELVLVSQHYPASAEDKKAERPGKE